MKTTMDRRKSNMVPGDVPALQSITLGRRRYVAGMEVGPSNGDPLQGNSVGVDGRGTAGEDCGMCSAGPLRQPLSHQRLRPGTRSLPRQFYHQPR